MLPPPKSPAPGSNKPSLLSSLNDKDAQPSRILATLEHAGPNKSVSGFRLEHRSVVMILLGVITLIGVLMLYFSAGDSAAPAKVGPKITRIGPDSMPAEKPSIDSQAAAVTPADLKPETTAALITNDPINPAALAAVSASASNSAAGNADSAAGQSSRSDDRLAQNSADAKSQSAGLPISAGLPASSGQISGSSNRSGSAAAKLSGATVLLNSIDVNRDSKAPRKSLPTVASGASSAAGLASNGSANPAKANAVGTAKSVRTQPVDNDVALLTALVANDSGQPIASIGNLNQANGTGRTPAANANRLAERNPTAVVNNRLDRSSVAVLAAETRNSDIVERKPDDSSGSLLQRCRQLGFLEGELCRWRICSDRWNSDAACIAQQDKK